jgi:hypothetical protein
MLEEIPIATAWLQALRARGVSVTLRNGRISMPKAAYAALSDDEILTLRHHRAAIRDVLASGAEPEAIDLDPVSVAPVTVALKEDRSSPLLSKEQDRERRSDEATAVMLKMMKFGHY